MKQMKRRICVFGFFIPLITIGLSTCSIDSPYLETIRERINAELGIEETYTVTYDANGAESGDIPTDVNTYSRGMTVTVLGNPGGLAKSGETFSGWNTLADGTGQTYTQGATFEMGVANVVLYARWTTNPTYTVIYKGNGHTGGSVPEDTTNYEEGMTVTVLGNSGGLTKDGGSFSGWNRAADGSNTGYAAGDTFTMGAEDVELYADWTPLWVNSYGSNSGVETLSSVFQTDDEGIVGVGTTNAGSGGGTDIYVFKLDENGDYIWQYSYGDSNDDSAAGGALLPDGRIAVVGNTVITGRGQEIRILCLNSDGTIYWQKTMGEGFDEYATDMDVTANGDIVISGSAYNQNDSTMDHMIMNIAPDGTFQWIETDDYDGSTTTDDIYVAVNAANDGSIYAAANRNFMRQYSSSGTPLISQSNLHAIDNTLANSVANDGLVGIGSQYAGTTNYDDLYIAKYDYSGNRLWDEFFGGSGDEEGFDMVQNANGTIIAVGTTTSNTGFGTDMIIVTISKDGDLLDHKTMKLSGDQEITSVALLDDDGVVIGGSTPFGTGTNILVMRLDTDLQPLTEQIPYIELEDRPILVGGGSSGGFPVPYDYSGDYQNTVLDEDGTSFLKNSIE